MLYPSINELKKKTSSGYALCILASKRSRDLIDGKPALTEDAPSKRPVSIAAQEIYEDLIGCHEDEPAKAEEYEVEATETGAEDEPEAEAVDDPAEDWE